MTTRESVRAFIATTLGLTPAETSLVFNPEIENITRPSECKAALSNAIRVNRLLSELYAAAQGQIQDASKIETNLSKTAFIQINMYLDELKQGKLPAKDKEIIESMCASYRVDKEKLVRESNTRMGHIQALTEQVQPTDKDEKAILKRSIKEAQEDIERIRKEINELKNTVPVFVRNIVDNIQPIVLTTIDITHITSGEVTLDTTPGALDKIVKTYVAEHLQATIGEVRVQIDIIKELIASVRKEMDALGYISMMLKNELYGMNRVDRDRITDEVHNEN